MEDIITAGGAMTIVFIVITAIIALFLLFLCVLWCILPFAIFGIKPKLDGIKNEIAKTNAHLQFISEQMRIYQSGRA